MTRDTTTAMAAIFDSLVGALNSSVSTRITQRHQDQRDLLAKTIFHREELHSDLITESARLLCIDPPILGFERKEKTCPKNTRN